MSLFPLAPTVVVDPGPSFLSNCTIPTSSKPDERLTFYFNHVCEGFCAALDLPIRDPFDVDDPLYGLGQTL